MSVAYREARKTSVEQLREIAAAVALGESLRSVARSLGIHDTTLKNRLLRADVYRPPARAILTGRRERALELADRGMSNRQIGEALGIQVDSARQLVMRARRALALAGGLRPKIRRERQPKEFEDMSEDERKALTLLRNGARQMAARRAVGWNRNQMSGKVRRWREAGLLTTVEGERG